MIKIKYRISGDPRSLLKYHLYCTIEEYKQLAAYITICGGCDPPEDVPFTDIEAFWNKDNTCDGPITEEEKGMIDEFAELHGFRRREYYDQQGEPVYSWEPPDGSGG